MKDFVKGITKMIPGFGAEYDTLSKLRSKRFLLKKCLNFKTIE